MVKVKNCMSVEKRMNTSIRARPSPRQTLGPAAAKVKGNIKWIKTRARAHTHTHTHTNTQQQQQHITA